MSAAVLPLLSFVVNLIYHAAPAAGIAGVYISMGVA